MRGSKIKPVIWSQRRRCFTKDANFSSPTASLDAIIITLIVDAHKGRDVAVANVPGAYLHAEWPKKTNMVLKLEGQFVEIICDVNKEYEKYVVYE